MPLTAEGQPAFHWSRLSHDRYLVSQQTIVRPKTCWQPSLARDHARVDCSWGHVFPPLSFASFSWLVLGCGLDGQLKDTLSFGKQIKQSRAKTSYEEK